MPEDYTLFSQADCRRKILRSVQGGRERGRFDCVGSAFCFTKQ